MDRLELLRNHLGSDGDGHRQNPNAAGFVIPLEKLFRNWWNIPRIGIMNVDEVLNNGEDTETGRE